MTEERYNRGKFAFRYEPGTWYYLIPGMSFCCQVPLWYDHSTFVFYVFFPTVRFKVFMLRYLLRHTRIPLQVPFRQTPRCHLRVLCARRALLSGEVCKGGTRLLPRAEPLISTRICLPRNTLSSPILLICTLGHSRASRAMSQHQPTQMSRTSKRMEDSGKHRLHELDTNRTEICGSSKPARGGSENAC